MLNFCLSCFNTKVTSNKVSTDGYEVTNLVSSDATRKRKGFLAYNAIKPPVEINFELICDIVVSHIIIWPEIGQQKSCGFRIEVGRKTPIHFNNLITVGQSYIENDGIVFKSNNCRFRDVEFPNNFSITYLSNKQSVLNSCSFIKLTVIKTLNSSLPAIKQVEIWGECSATCSRELRNEISQIWQCYKNHSNKSVFKTVHDIKCTADKTLLPQSLVVPDDFIDPITCEIMAVPMILPCGKIIDRSTLEKHEKVEAAWGRVPNDPFTGKLFTESSHPVIAVSLKSRIDKFLVDNSDKVELFSVPRTLGRYLKESVSGLENCSSNASVSITTPVPVNSRKRTLGASKCEVNKKFSFNPNKSVLCSMSETKPISLASSTSDEELDLSLEHALKNTLSNLPSFIKPTNECSISKKMCGHCTQMGVLYSLACNHFLCRECLLEKTGKQQLSCPLCHHMFNKSDVTRINT